LRTDTLQGFVPRDLAPYTFLAPILVPPPQPFYPHFLRCLFCAQKKPPPLSPFDTGSGQAFMNNTLCGVGFIVFDRPQSIAPPPSIMFLTTVTSLVTLNCVCCVFTRNIPCTIGKFCHILKRRRHAPAAAGCPSSFPPFFFLKPRPSHTAYSILASSSFCANFDVGPSSFSSPIEGLSVPCPGFLYVNFNFFFPISPWSLPRAIFFSQKGEIVHSLLSPLDSSPFPPQNLGCFLFTWSPVACLR